MFCIADYSNHAIRKLILSTLAVNVWIGAPTPTATSGYVDGIGTNVRLNHPIDIDISPDGTFALFVEETNHALRKIIISTSTVNVLAGAYPTPTSGFVDGIGTNARFYDPYGLGISPDGTYALVAELLESCNS